MAGKFSSHVRSNVVGYVAVFIALSGSAYAAVALEKNQVKSKHIGKGQVKNPDLANNSVTSPKVADGSLLNADFAAGQLPRGEQGPPGEAGPPGSPDTPQQVLGKIKEVDGSGSGLDSDQLDGIDSQVLHRTEAGGRTLVDAGTLPATDSEATIALSMGTVGILCASTNALHRYQGEQVDIWTDNGFVDTAASPDSVDPFHATTTNLGGALENDDDRMTYFIVSATHVAQVELLSHFSGSSCTYTIIASEFRR